MKKVFRYLFVLFCLIGICSNVYATQTTPTAVVDVVDRFFECLEDNDECAYDYISVDSVSLENTVNERLDDFDDIEYTLGTTISYGVVDNMFPDVDGKDAIKVPVTVKNVGDESTSVSTLWLKLYGPSGNELANVEYYFDDSIAYAGSLLPGATKDTYIYLLYIIIDSLYQIY